MHLSDIHLKAENNRALKRREEICRAFQNLALEADNIFVVISGDIAYCGKSEEYQKAKDLLDSIKNRIENYSQKTVRFIMVPGNHDCCFEIGDRRIRENLIRDIEKNVDININESTIEKCCEIQNNFVEFSGFYQDDRNILCSDKLFTIIEYGFEAFNIVFYCYNTSWVSKLREQPGTMFLPINRFPRDFLKLRSNLSISILHHPFNWQNPRNARDLSTHLESTSDIVLTGHGHIASKSLKDDLEGNYTEFIEGAILQEGEEGENSGFNVIFVDLENEKQKVYQYVWNGELYSVIKEPDEWSPYKRFKGINKRVHKINSNFEKKLNDPGGLFYHPLKPDLTLDDIFVYPQVQDLTLDRKDKDINVLIQPLDSEILLEIDKSANRVLLIGTEKSGKTALCKMLFKHYHNNGYVPVYMDGSKIRSTSIDRFNIMVNQSYGEQYSPNTLERFNQLENVKKMVIIDDFDKLRLNIKYRAALLNNINKYYPNIILTGNDLFQIGEIISEENQPKIALEGYKQFGILQFGNVMRSRLIDKWNRLGIEEQIEEDELIRKNDGAKHIIDAVIGKNFVPSYPIFLLTLLQAFEAGQPHSLEESAYGHYYNFLITRAIGRIVRSNDKIDAYYNFLTELANYLFENKTHVISKDIMGEFHTWYRNEFTISPSMTEVYNLGELIKNQLNASMIEERWDGYCFKEKYIYYFFMAKYVADNITKENIRQRISQMCQRLYREEFASVILFLTHHSRDPFILNEILGNAKSLFSEFPVAKLEEETLTVNDLLGEIPKIVLEKRDVREDRLRRDSSKDETELAERESTRDEEEIPDLNEEIIELDFVSELNLAFKTVEILGQILKNYHSSLRGGPKFALAEEAYYLGLRSLNPFFTILKENADYVARLIGIYIKKKKLVDADRIEETSRKLVFILCAMLCYGFIKKISHSVGSEHLSETFKQLREKNDINSVHLVDAAIKLDFYRAFPYGDIQELRKRIANNLLPYSILRQMVLDYLYMFPTNVRDKQRICSLLGISMDTQRLIAVRSTQKKR